jgi:hypothetical protein
MITPVAEQQIQTDRDATTRRNSRLAFWVIFSALTALYIACTVIDARRFVWFDELFTYDIARAPSLHQLWAWVLRFDNHPPAAYLLSRFSMAIFGPTPFALRLPSIIEFYLGSVAIFFYLRRKAGDAIGGFAILVLWGTRGIFQYATEARPYALVFMGFAFLLLCWDIAAHYEGRKPALFGVAFSTAVLLSAHVFAPLSLLPFLVAETVRFFRRREPDYPLWSALLLPTVVMLVYVPIIRVYNTILIPPALQASWAKIGTFAFDSFSKALLLAALVFLVLPKAIKGSRPMPKFAAEDLALLACLLFNPILLTMVLMWRHGFFSNRYCLTSSVAIYLALALLLSIPLRPGYAAIGLASLVMIASLVHGVSRVSRLPRVDPVSWATVRPDLPVVASSGATFYEMNHHENPWLLSRLYFLKDRAAAIKYQGINLFDDFEAPDAMKSAGIPLPAHVEPYRSFVAQHREFLVLGDARDWPMRKLADEGAAEEALADYSSQSPYRTGFRLYLVKLH